MLPGTAEFSVAGWVRASRFERDLAPARRMIAQLRRIYALLDVSQRRQLRWLLVAIVLTGLMEVVGISSIFPFMAVVARPESVQTNAAMLYVYNLFGFQSQYRFLFALGLVVLAITLLGNAIAAAMSAMMLRFGHRVGSDLAVRVLGSYLAKPYTFFLSRNSATMSLNIIGETNGMVMGAIVPALQTFAKLLVAAFILLLLLAVDPLLALIVAVAVGGSYFLVFVFVRSRLSTIGRQSNAANRVRHKVVSEALGGIKDLKILGRLRSYQETFSAASSDYARYQVQNGLIATLPRYAMESIAFGGILLILLYLLSVRRDVNQALPLIALYAMAGFRLMPAIQQIFGGLAQVRFSLSSLENLHREIDELARVAADVVPEADQRPVRFERSIEMRGIFYRHAGAERDTLRGVSLTIAKNTTVGLVGLSGSGKTTLMDIMLGLLSPTAGELLVDGVPLGAENAVAWRGLLGYVPQTIFLAEDSIERNIAFGLTDTEIDHSLVARAARLASLHDFIDADLPAGYATMVGERGIRLSGGQRQRVGIARALYHDPDILLLDEATSALDGMTEDAIIDAIRSLAHTKTVILIAHRFSTIRDCDVLFLVDQGRIVDSGTYDDLLARNAAFRELGKLSLGAAPVSVGSV